MNNFFQRALTGAIFVGVMLACTFAGSLFFILLIMLITLIGLVEYANMITGYGFGIQKHSFYAAGILISALLFYSALPASISLNSVPLVLVILACLFFAELFTRSEKPFASIAVSITGIVYVVIPFGLFVLIAHKNKEYNPQMVLAYFLLQWCSDTLQYLFGVTMGRTKLFERISPKKSWEGFIGGLVSTIILAYFMETFFPFHTRTQWMVIAFLIVVFGTLGDLAESLLKRSVGVKDSGTLMPGHGGVLDRFDGLLGSAPFVYAYLYYFS